jgi:uncharacterized protein GlcG (DUF336 family)
MLNLRDATTVLNAVLAKADELDAPVSVAVVDDGGYIVAVGRTDAAFRLSPDIAISKAYTAAILRRPTSDLKSVPSDVLSARRDLGVYPMNPSGGGVPLIRDGEVVGAIGVGGSLPDHDVECANAGIAAFGS